MIAEKQKLVWLLPATIAQQPPSNDSPPTMENRERQNTTPSPHQSIDSHRRQLHPIPKVPAANRHSHLPTNPNLLSKSLPLHESGAGVSGRRPIRRARSGKTTRRNIRRKTSAQPTVHHPTTPPSQRRLEQIDSTAPFCRTRRIRLAVIGNQRKKRRRFPRRRFLHQRHGNANPADLL